MRLSKQNKIKLARIFKILNQETRRERITGGKLAKMCGNYKR